MSNKDSLGDRQKSYEACSRDFLLPNTPVIIRVDGKAFHTYCRNMEKPFDTKFISAMTRAANAVAGQIQGFKFGYVQSDEATFVLTDYDTHQTQGWFNYNKSKMISISSALMTYFFSEFMEHSYLDASPLPIFDSRAFNVPHTDVVNNVLWRAKDWQRNSLQMYCRAHFSQKAMHGKNATQQHDMLHQIGRNWSEDLGEVLKNGTYFSNYVVTSDVLPRFESINEFAQQSGFN